MNTRASQDANLNALINAGIREGGGVQFDIVPTQNSANGITSGGMYNTLRDSNIGFVDEEPTAGSNNLVKSGGVYKYIFEKDILPELSLTEDHILNYTNGQVEQNQYTSGYACTDYLYVSFGDLIKFAFVKGRNLCLGCVYDEQKNFLYALWGTDDNIQPSTDIDKEGFIYKVLDRRVSYIRYNIQTDSVYPRNKQYITKFDLSQVRSLMSIYNRVNSIIGNGIFNLYKFGCVYDNNLNVINLPYPPNCILTVQTSKIKNYVSIKFRGGRDSGLPLVVGINNGNAIQSLRAAEGGTQSYELVLNKSEISNYDTLGIAVTIDNLEIKIDDVEYCSGDNTEDWYCSKKRTIINPEVLQDNAFLDYNGNLVTNYSYKVYIVRNLEEKHGILCGMTIAAGTIITAFAYDSSDNFIGWYGGQWSSQEIRYFSINLDAELPSRISYVKINSYKVYSSDSVRYVELVEDSFIEGEIKREQDQIAEKNDFYKKEKINFLLEATNKLVIDNGDISTSTFSGYNVFKTTGLIGKTGFISINIWLGGDVRKAFIYDANNVLIDSLEKNNGSTHYNQVYINLTKYNGLASYIRWNTYSIYAHLINPGELYIREQQYPIINNNNIQVIVDNVTDLVNAIQNGENKTIYVKEGTYNVFDVFTPTASTWGLFMKSNCKLIGLGNVNNVIIRGYLPDTTSPSIIDKNSTLNGTRNFELKNLTIIGHNTRYCFHSDNGEFDNSEGKDTTITVENCRFIHEGIFVSGTTNNSPTAWGMGTWSGSKRIFKNCYFESPNVPAWGTHNQLNQEKPGYTLLENCSFITKKNTSSVQNLSNFCMLIQSVGNRLNDVVDIRNCCGNAKFAHWQNPFSGGINVGCDYSIIGSGCVPFQFIVSGTNEHYDQNYIRYVNTQFGDTGAYYIAGNDIVQGKFVSIDSNGFVVATSNKEIAIGIAMTDAEQGNKVWIQHRGSIPVSILGSNIISNVGSKISYIDGIWRNVTDNPQYIVNMPEFILI